MEIPFFKMHGAANDFIVVDDRALTFPEQDRDWMAAVMQRHTGVGAEGVLLIQPSDTADFRMRFFNPDGGEVDMCGNGARCIARLAHELGVAPRVMTFDTPAGTVGAELDATGETVRLTMTPPKDWRLDAVLELDGEPLTYHFVNSGVPHVVVERDDLDRLDLARFGAALRYHPAFAPGGTNVNVIQVTGPSALRIRTYERGVEAETPACGTGIVACGLIAGRTGRCTPPVRVTTAGGYTLAVDFRLIAAGAEQVSLTGPAEKVFRGCLSYRPG